LEDILSESTTTSVQSKSFTARVTVGERGSSTASCSRRLTEFASPSAIYPQKSIMQLVGFKKISDKKNFKRKNMWKSSLNLPMIRNLLEA
jgi:hypothetical protein